MAEYSGTEQPPAGAEDGIGAAASSAYMEALEGGATPQEAFDAAAGAAQEVATEMGMPQDEFDAGLEAATQAFTEAVDGGAGPAAAPAPTSISMASWPPAGRTAPLPPDPPRSVPRPSARARRRAGGARP